LEQLPELAPTARGLLIEVPDGKWEWGDRAIATAADHGLHIALVMPQDLDPFSLVGGKAALDRHYETVHAVSAPCLVFFGYQNLHGAARHVSADPVGPGANPRLDISGEVPTDRREDLLVRRAFGDFQRVALRRLGGGKSGAAVFLVDVGGEDRKRRSQPFVVKMHSREKIGAEKSNSEVVRNLVAPRLYVPLHADRCVEGSELGLVVYDVMDRAAPLRSVLATATPEALVGSLFGETLRNFRTHAEDKRSTALIEFGERGLKAIKWTPGLEEAASAARATDGEVLDVPSLRSLLDERSAMTIRSGVVHGDLHVGNLFVSGMDVMMIDYGSVRQGAPLAADYACLEISLTFPPQDEVSGEDAPTTEWLHAMYQSPLRRNALTDGAPTRIARSVEAIRQGAQAVVSGQEYVAALAAYLLRAAAYPDHAEVRQRALAYSLASKLFLSAFPAAGEVRA